MFDQYGNNYNKIYTKEKRYLCDKYKVSLTIICRLNISLQFKYFTMPF